jgi:hypothetical protein
MPRARIEDAQGHSREWHSRMIPRYQRRTERVDEAILGVYLSGTNTRRLRGALSPLLRGAPLSKDAVSRLDSEDMFLEAACADDFLGVQGYTRQRVGQQGLLPP